MQEVWQVSPLSGKWKTTQPKWLCVLFGADSSWEKTTTPLIFMPRYTAFQLSVTELPVMASTRIYCSLIDETQTAEGRKFIRIKQGAPRSHLGFVSILNWRYIPNSIFYKFDPAKWSKRFFTLYTFYYKTRTWCGLSYSPSTISCRFFLTLIGGFQLQSD